MSRFSNRFGEPAPIFPELISFEIIGVQPLNGIPKSEESTDKLPINKPNQPIIDRFTKPNRPNKRRGDKLNNWNHSSTPYGEKGRTELEDRQITQGKRAGCGKKRYLYRIDYIWHTSCFNIKWHRGGKYTSLRHAEQAWEGVEKGAGFMGKLGDKFRMVDIKTGEIIKELVKPLRTVDK